MELSQKKKVIIIDGNAILHRAFHALPPLTRPDGMIVNAVYGFFSMFLTILHDMHPTHIIVAFDRGKPTFRQTMYAGYHQNRPKMSDDLFPQIAVLYNALEKLGVVMYGIEGYEADDVIGTLAKKIVDEAKEKTVDTEVIIVTGDRDLLQLVNKHVFILMPIVGVKNTVLFDEKAVEEKYGVTPEQFIDYKALIGDQSDGYPGVTGIGPKTAANLLSEYKTFENLYQQIASLPKKTGLKLATDAEQAALAKQLATIVTDVPLQLDLEKCHSLELDTNALTTVFEELGFNSLIKRFGLRFAQHEKEKEERKTKTDQLTLL